jgi:hydroxypyruvate isomerase
MKASICIEMIYTESPFLDRILLAAEQGFDAVEFWNWDNKDMKGIKAAAAAAGIAVAVFQSNRGGTMINPAHRDSFLAGIRESLTMANEMGATRLFLLTDELGEDRGVRFKFPEIPWETQRQSVLGCLKELAPLAEKAGVTLVLEPLNTYVDHAGYFLNHSSMGLELVRAVGSPNIRLLYDVYHMQIMEGNLIPTLTGNLDAIGHVHIADTPGRHEPGTGEINYAVLLRKLREADYQGYVGCEFAPTIPSTDAAAQALALIRG